MPDQIDLLKPYHSIWTCQHVQQEPQTFGKQAVSQYLLVCLCLHFIIGHAFSESTNYKVQTPLFSCVDQCKSPLDNHIIEIIIALFLPIALLSTASYNYLSSYAAHPTESTESRGLLEEPVTQIDRSIDHISVIKHNYVVQMIGKEKIFSSLENAEQWSSIGWIIIYVLCPPQLHAAGNDVDHL